MSIVGDEIGIIQPKVFKQTPQEHSRWVFDYTCRELNSIERRHGPKAMFDFINANANKYAPLP